MPFCYWWFVLVFVLVLGGSGDDSGGDDSGGAGGGAGDGGAGAGGSDSGFIPFWGLWLAQSVRCQTAALCAQNQDVALPP
jgi:hypothetical protein